MNGHKDYSVADDPPYSKLFVVFNRNDPVTDDELRSDFSLFGEIQDLFQVKDRKTGKSSGIAYIKFSKMSDAAIAMETMNNTEIKSHKGSYKICIAKSKGEPNDSDAHDPDRYARLFVLMPKTTTEDQLNDYFGVFGSIKSIKIVRHRETNECKGIAYITYDKVSDAAKAVEAGENEFGFKAVIARPKEKSEPVAKLKEQPIRRGQTTIVSDNVSETDYFFATVSAALNREQVHRIFDIAPGLIDIQIESSNRYRIELKVTYKSMVAAEYARGKIHGIEYPIGDFIAISMGKSQCQQEFGVASQRRFPDESGFSARKRYQESSDHDFRNSPPRKFYAESGYSYSYDRSEKSTSGKEEDRIRELTRALNEATALLKSRHTSHGYESADSPPPLSKISSAADDLWSKYCDFTLPPLKQVLDKSEYSEDTGMRLFFVGQPGAPPVDALYDVFCRFGNFAGVSITSKKNYGYLYFTNPDSGLAAIEAIDDRMICGMTMKVLKAEPKGEPVPKRKRSRH